jgi:ABC-2 type transport system ATP-binding protein
MTLTASNVTVRYGRKTAVDDVTLHVPPGSVYALLGRNGAGKSSLIRCLLGLRKPERGTITLLDVDAWTGRARVMDRVGVVPEEADAPPAMKVRDLADFCSRVYSRWRQSVFDERLRRFSVDGAARFGDLSKGQKKQVSLALALSMTPELLVLDDPTLGLDVVARKSLFEEVIGELSERGITTLIATHDLSGIEGLADRVGVLRDGKLVLDEEMETLKSRFRRIRFTASPVAITSLAATAVRSWGSGTEAIVSNFDDLAFERFRTSNDVSHAEIAALSLEEIFIAMAGEERTQS